MLCWFISLIIMPCRKLVEDNLRTEYDRFKAALAPKVAPQAPPQVAPEEAPKAATEAGAAAPGASGSGRTGATDAAASVLRGLQSLTPEERRKIIGLAESS